jgi:ATP-dependent Clp protease ATP-binding subunit ClpC
MFEQFTEQAIKAVNLGLQESIRLGHNFVGAENILLGLIAEDTGVAATVLKASSINLNDTRIVVEKLIGRGSGFLAAEIPFTPRAKRALEYARDESKQLGHKSVDTEHLLLGLIRDAESEPKGLFKNPGIVAKILKQHRIDLKDLRKKVMEAIPAIRPE